MKTSATTQTLFSSFAASLGSGVVGAGGCNKLFCNNSYRKSVWMFVLICSVWMMIMIGNGVEAYRINFDDNHGTFTSEVSRGKLLDEYELGMYAREDLPLRFLTRPIANGDTFVQVYMHVQKSSIPTPDTKLVLVVANSEILSSGFKKDQNNEYLCGDEGLVPTSQSTLDDDGVLYYKYFSGDEVIDENFEVPVTGLYQYKLFYCPSTSPSKERPKTGEASFKLNGHIQFINPYGHLPGQYFFFLPFQACMTIAYIVFAILWFLASIFNRKEFLTLQFYITIVLMSCLAESLIVYFDYFLTNKIGSRNFVVQICSMCMTVIRKTWTRLIILVVCSGYSSATKEEDDESSENNTNKRGVTTTMIIIYAVIFAISCSISEFGEFLFFRELISHTQYLFTMIPTSFLDFFFYAWSVYLLSSTMKMYKPSNPKFVTAKERASTEWRNAVANNHYFYLYRRLMFAMIIYAWTVLIFLVLQFFYEYGQYYRSAWYLNWLFDSGSYQVAFFAFFVLLGFLYRPAKHNSLYLHSEQLPTDELDADMMLKEGTGLEYQSDDSDEQDVEMMMMQNNEPIDHDEESDSKDNRKSQEKLVFSEDHETPTSSTPAVEKVENTTQQ